MSSSIDSYYRRLPRISTSRQTETTAADEQQKEESTVSTTKRSIDKLEFSPSLTRQLSGTDEVEETPTETYTPVGRPPMSIEDMKSFLSSVEEQLGLADSDIDAYGSASDLLSGISEQLEGYNADTATDEETASVFDSVMQSLHSLMPPPPPPPDSGEESAEASGTSSLPPLMQAMGGRMTPFFIQSEEEESLEANTAFDLSSLSAEDKSALLTKLQNALNGWSSSAAGEDASVLLFKVMDEITAAASR